VYPDLSTYNTEFVALAIGTVNLVEWELLLRVVVVWALSIVSAQLIETTLFMGKLLR